MGVPTPKAPLINTLSLHVVLAPLSLDEALISTWRVTVPNRSIESTAPAANLVAESLIGYAIVVQTFKTFF